ncbi:sensor histidine kinase [Pseudofulvibacter geojedonensis]|uniref:histidine kinase n=1 Tax=Pseudofulvibacter geojedonensis TaxID=1123758 RepID=A0ABW3I0H0_9FLAO
MPKLKSKRYLIVIFSSILLFTIDLILPLGLAIGLLYVLLVFCSLLFNKQKSPIYLSILSTVLTLLGFFYSIETATVEWIVISNRLLTILSIWAVGFLLFKINIKTNNIKKINYRLDEKLEDLKLKNEELQQFSYITSHDLQEPIKNILSFTMFLKEENSFDNQSLFYLDQISNSVNKLSNLIKSLLDYHLIGQRSEVKKINCSLVVHSVIKKLNIDNAHLEFNKLPNIYGFKEEFEILIYNLLSNAFKFNKSEKPFVKIKCYDKEKFWQFSIQDNGIGIDPKYFEKIFFMYQQLHHKNDFEGIGVGLTFCKKIIELHKGTIWVESNNNGSTFYFTIKKYIHLD